MSGPRVRLWVSLLVLPLLVAGVVAANLWLQRPARVTVVAGPSPFGVWDDEAIAAEHGAGQPCSGCHADTFRDRGDPSLAPVPPQPVEGEAPETESDGLVGEGEEGEGGGGPGRRLNWFWQQRAYPLDTIPVEATERAWREARQMASVQSAAETWTNIGPHTIADGLIGISSCGPTDCTVWRTNVSGRVKAIAIHPTDSNIVYVGTATGGVWKSTDGGASYAPLTDHLPAFAIFSLALDPTNPNIIYAGTGEIAGYYGMGVLKSTNGGASWTTLGANEFAGLVVSSIVVHPSNPNIIYAATAHPLMNLGPNTALPGIFKSTNGGASWQAQLQCTAPCYGFSDLVMEDTSPNTLYAGFAASGILKTTNGGGSWDPVPNFPDRGYTRVELAIGKGAGAGTLYAGLAARVQVGSQVQPWGLMMKSTNHGQTWQQMSAAPNYCSSQCIYDNVVAVDPRNANTVYIGGSFIAQGNRWAGVVHKSTNGGASWGDMTPGTSLDRMVHPDMHAITLDPSNPDIVWIGNDGGIFRSTNGGQTWAQRNGNLNTLQFVNIGVHPTNQNIAFGGLQDNAKAKYNGSGWVGLDTGDGGYSEIDPFNPQIWYSTRYSLQGVVIQFQRNEKGGTAPLADWPQRTTGISYHDRVEFYAPFTMDPSTPGVLYFGTHKLYRTTNRGDLWVPISGDLTKGSLTNGSITAIGVAPAEPRTIYVGASDGNVQVTRSTGATWTNVTRAPLPNRSVSDFAIDPSNAQIAYVALNGYNAHTPGESGHVFKTSNAGGSWQNVSGNLPDVPALSIVLDPSNPTHLYVGTDLGVFRSTNGGGSWANFSSGLAQVPVYDLELQGPTRLLWAGTYGRGVYRVSLAGAAPTPTATTTPTATRTPGGEGHVQLPFILLMHRAATPTPTPTLPASGPAPGAWSGSRASFNVTTDQADVWDIRILAPVPGCETWVSSPDMAPVVAGGDFAWAVDLRANGQWAGSGHFSDRTSASGTAEFTNMYFGQSCGTWSGTVNWTASWQSDAPNPTMTPTTQPGTPTATPPTQAGIHGQVRYEDAGVAGISVVLRRCSDQGVCGEDSLLSTMQTDAGGYYAFTDAPTLPAGMIYFVWYANTTLGGNVGDDRYLWRWYAPVIWSYTAGASMAGGDFDIEDIHLLAPAGETATLPVTFRWSTRERAGEHFAWELFDLTTGLTVCDSGDTPLAAPGYTLTAADFVGRCGGQYGVTYGWFPWVTGGPSWDEGYGDSYYYAEITFQSAGGPTPTRTPTTPVTATPTATTPPPGGIYGTVRYAGGGVAGVTLGLWRGSTLVATTVSAGGGAYRFSNPPALLPGQSYRVIFDNSVAGGNTPNPNRLAYWYAPVITSYAAGANVAGGDFDIRDVTLASPGSGAWAYIPTTFVWNGRGVGSDRYSWAIADAGLVQKCYVDPPGSSTSFVLTGAGAGACGLFYDTPYYWYVYVASGGWANGYGLSYYARLITWPSSGMRPRENRLLLPEGVPPLAPGALPWGGGLPGAGPQVEE